MLRNFLVPASEILTSLSDSAVRFGRWARASGLFNGLVYLAFTVVMLLVLIDM